MCEKVYCLRCNRVVDGDGSLKVIKTGFRRVNGVDYPLALCIDGKHSSAANNSSA